MPRSPPPCQFCGESFALGQTVRLVWKYDTRADGSLGPFMVWPPVWTPICIGCFYPEDHPEIARRKHYERRCEGCGQPMLAPLTWCSIVTTCSSACAQYVRRQRKRGQRSQTQCVVCGTGFDPKRNDAHFCSSACRQAAYRQRMVTGEKPAPSEDDDEQVIHLDDIAGVLHYRDRPILAVANLHASRSGFGNRYVSRLTLAGAEVLKPILRAEGRRKIRIAHIFECLECRLWSVGPSWVFCSRKCRLVHRAEQARERRMATR